MRNKNLKKRVSQDVQKNKLNKESELNEKGRG